MKHFFAKTRAMMVALVLGGLFFVSTQASAQSTSALIAPPPNNQSWVTTPQASQTVQDEIAAMTQELILAQAPEAELKQLKFKLQFMMYVQQALNQGAQIGEALNLAKSMLIGTDAVDSNAKKAEKAQKIYDEMVGKFTN
ncbi:MAG: hypothetical protein H6568_04735 [Lewinellaceae bacterium]|nr:hypothetical protein [Lewinellaceae bacterium]